MKYNNTSSYVELATFLREALLVIFKILVHYCIHVHSANTLFKISVHILHKSGL